MRFIRPILFLSFGAFSTIAVAWAVAIFLAPPFPSLLTWSLDPKPTSWPISVPETWHPEPASRGDASGIGWTASVVSGISRADRDRLSRFEFGSISVRHLKARVLRVGLPFPALQLESISARISDDSGVRTGLAITANGDWRLPLRPHWPGFLADSACFSVIGVSATASARAICRVLARRTPRSRVQQASA